MRCGVCWVNVAPQIARLGEGLARLTNLRILSISGASLLSREDTVRSHTLNQGLWWLY